MPSLKTSKNKYNWFVKAKSNTSSKTELRPRDIGSGYGVSSSTSFSKSKTKPNMPKPKSKSPSRSKSPTSKPNYQWIPKTSKLDEISAGQCSITNMQDMTWDQVLKVDQNGKPSLSMDWVPTTN